MQGELTMRNLFIPLALAGVGCAGAAMASGTSGVKPAATIAGDYVEARTASVFAGACHYNGELTTTGRDAEIVWHVKSGSVQGVDMSGLTVVAAVSAGDNLKDDITGRRSVLYIDDRATGAQMK